MRQFVAQLFIILCSALAGAEVYAGSCKAQDVMPLRVLFPRPDAFDRDSINLLELDAVRGLSIHKWPKELQESFDKLSRAPTVPKAALVQLILDAILSTRDLSPDEFVEITRIAFDLFQEIPIDSPAFANFEGKLAKSWADLVILAYGSSFGYNNWIHNLASSDLLVGSLVAIGDLVQSRGNRKRKHDVLAKSLMALLQLDLSHLDPDTHKKLKTRLRAIVEPEDLKTNFRDGQFVHPLRPEAMNDLRLQSLRVLVSLGDMDVMNLLLMTSGSLMRAMNFYGLDGKVFPVMPLDIENAYWRPDAKFHHMTAWIHDLWRYETSGKLRKFLLEAFLSDESVLLYVMEALEESPNLRSDTLAGFLDRALLWIDASESELRAIHETWDILLWFGRARVLVETHSPNLDFSERYPVSYPSLERHWENPFFGVLRLAASLNSHWNSVEFAEAIRNRYPAQANSVRKVAEGLRDLAFLRDREVLELHNRLPGQLPYDDWMRALDSPELHKLVANLFDLANLLESKPAMDAEFTYP